MHGCESLHVESVAVKEVFKGQTVSTQMNTILLWAMYGTAIAVMANLMAFLTYLLLNDQDDWGKQLMITAKARIRAPAVYEDEHGFYTVRNGAVKYGVPDSKKARRTRSSLNWAMHRTLRIKAFRVRGLPFFGKRVLHVASEFSATSRRRAGSCR